MKALSDESAPMGPSVTRRVEGTLLQSNERRAALRLSVQSTHASRSADLTADPLHPVHALCARPTRVQSGIAMRTHPSPNRIHLSFPPRSQVLLRAGSDIEIRLSGSERSRQSNCRLMFAHWTGRRDAYHSHLARYFS